ncbi:MAG TPA: hypothetical protein VNJ53_06725 [Gaiellaceae bacterium]|nr:hypothetical protein [Gaiellaceae bacterium]
MAIARVVTFEGVSAERMASVGTELERAEQPEGLNATEFILLHDPDSERALAIVFFETEEDYRRGDEVLSAMPADETPGRRTSVERYEVALRVSR